jgi:streptogramin lyase
MTVNKLRRSLAILLSVFALGFIQIFTAGIAVSAPRTGDLITTGRHLSVSPSGAVLCVDPISGFVEIISSGGLLKDVNGVVVSSAGDIYVTCDGRPSGFVGVVKVNPKTGEQTAISEGGLIIIPFAITIDQTGMLLVVEATNAVVQVDPTSGSQTLIASGDMLQSPFGIEVEEDGNVLVTTKDAGQGYDGIVRIDPSDGSQSLVTEGATQEQFLGLGINESGDIYLGNSITNNGEILRVNPETGEQTLVAGGHPLDWVYDIAVSSTGDLYVANGNHFQFGYIIHVHPTNGAKTIIAQTDELGLLAGVKGIAIYPDTSVQTVPKTWGEIKASRR